MTTITLPRAVVEQALEALKDDQYRLVEVSPNQYEYKTDLAIAALERALAQRAESVEPVAWMFELARNFNLEGYGGWEKRITEYRPNTPEGSVRNVTPLYTAPPQRKPLTEEEIDAMWRDAVSEEGFTTAQFVRNFARAIERAHGIGEEK